MMTNVMTIPASGNIRLDPKLDIIAELKKLDGTVEERVLKPRTIIGANVTEWADSEGRVWVRQEYMPESSHLTAVEDSPLKADHDWKVEYKN